MANNDFQIKHPRIEQFISDADRAYDAIALLQTSAADMSEEILRSYLAALAWACGVSVVFQLPQELEVVRARRLDDKEWPCLKKELGYPPPEVTKRGRCNQLGDPLLYVSLYEDTALAEIGATRGDHCVISTFELLAALRFVPVGQFDLYRRTGEAYIGAMSQTNTIYDQIMAMPTSELSALFDAFLADEFLRPSSSDVDYKISSIFSDILLKGDLKPTKPIDAIVYPSVAFRHGLNFALRSDAYDSQVKLVKAEVLEIKEALGFGLFRYKKLATLETVTSDQQLVWKAESQA
jgi:hypothetical protein